MNHLSLQKEICIHFVCTGNAYRSRLAEAYLKAKQLPWLHISSSGTVGEHSFLENGPISWWAMRLIYNNHLMPFMSVSPIQTAPQFLEQADIVIFMSQEHYQRAKDHLGYQGTCYQIWNIADLNETLADLNETLESDIAIIKSTEHAFKQIREKVDFLVEDLKICIHLQREEHQ